MAETRYPVIEETASENRDPVTGAPGAHPVGVGIGAATGGAAGAALGAAAGPIGAVVGAGVGAIAGALAGKAVAEGIDPTIEDAFWRKNYGSRPYVSGGARYEEYRPAYRYGWEARTRYPNRKFEDVESELARDWDRYRDTSTLPWSRAHEATRDAWERVSGRTATP